MTPAARFGVVDEPTARMAWARLAEPDDVAARRLVGRLGLREAFDRVLTHEGVDPAAPLPEAQDDRDAQRFVPRLRALDVERDVHITRAVGARVVFPGDEEWPKGLDDLEHPPWCLWVIGPAHLGQICERSVSIVGARAATHYGVFATTEIAGGMAARGFAVVSGAAFGVDAAAHRAALAADGTTIAVLACGVERDYPSGHQLLLAEIRDSGAAVSEVGPGAAPARLRFLARNRLIAALSCGTIVVEAGIRSGARTTVKEASLLARPVGAVPGPVTSMVSAGCHEEIRMKRAELVTDAAEAAELVGAFGRDLAAPKRGPVRSGDHLEELPRRVYTNIPHHTSRTVDDLCRVAGLAPGEVLGALGDLEAGGLVERRLDGWGKVRKVTRR